MLKMLAIALIAIAAAAGSARAECLHSAQEVWKAHPGTRASWSLRLEGHKGEKCWFAAKTRTAKRAVTPLPKPAPRRLEETPEMRTIGVGARSLQAPVVAVAKMEVLSPAEAVQEAHSQFPPEAYHQMLTASEFLAGMRLRASSGGVLAQRDYAIARLPGSR